MALYRESGKMKYLFLCFIVPGAVSFLTQTVLCHKTKRRILSYGALLFTIISMATGAILLLTRCKDMFGGLDVIEAVLWLIGGCAAALGYGAEWLWYFVARKGKNMGKKFEGAYEEKNNFVCDSGNDGVNRVRRRGEG